MLKKLRVTVTAGPTREMLDPVRFLSNVSTGQMGYELAREAKQLGFQVSLVSGPTHLDPPQNVFLIRVVTAHEMKQAIKKLWPKTDVLIMTAAVCDYTPVHFSPRKIKRIKQKSIQFKRTEDILSFFGKRKGKRLLVGFALETDHFLEYAVQKLKAKNLDLIVLNWYNQTHNPFGQNKASMILIDRNGKRSTLRRMSKQNAAHEILAETITLLESSTLSH